MSAAGGEARDGVVRGAPSAVAAGDASILRRSLGFFTDFRGICAGLKDLGGGATDWGTRITRMNSNDANQSPACSRPAIVEKELSHAIVGCFFEVYNELALGLELGILLHFGPVPRFHRELGDRRTNRAAYNSG